MKASKWIFLIIAVSILGFALLYKVNPNIVTNDTTSIEEAKEKEYDKQYEMVIEKMGGTSESAVGPVTQDQVDSGVVLKKVYQYKTLAEAESDMGYYLGFHNDMKSVPEYHLIAISNVGEKAWFQATFQHEESDKWPDIVVKTSKESPLESLKITYSSTMNDIVTRTYHGISVEYAGNGEYYKLVSFETPNNKAYTLYCNNGFKIEYWEPIVKELISNLVIMDDWVDY